MYLNDRIVRQHLFVLCLCAMVVHLTLCERRSLLCQTDVCEVDVVVGQDIEILFQFLDKNLTDLDTDSTYLVLIDNDNKTHETLIAVTRSNSAAGTGLTIFKEKGRTGKVQIKPVSMDYFGEYRVEIQINNTLIYHIVNISITVYQRDKFDTPKCVISYKPSKFIFQLNCQWNTTGFYGEAWILFGESNLMTRILGNKRRMSYYTPTYNLSSTSIPPPSCIVSRLGVVKTCNFSSVNQYTVNESVENNGPINTSPYTEEHMFPDNNGATTCSTTQSTEPQNVHISTSITVLVLISCTLTIIFTTSVCIFVSCSKFIRSKCGKSRSSTELNSPLNQNQAHNGLSEQDVELQAVSLHLKDEIKVENRNHGSEMLRDTSSGRSNQRQSSQRISEEATSKKVSRKNVSGPPCVTPEQRTVGYAFDNGEYFDLGEIANCPEQEIETGSACKVDLPDNIYSDVEYFQNGCCSVPPNRDNENSRDCLAQRSQGMGCGDSKGKGCDHLDELYAKVDRNKDRASQFISNPSCDADNSSPTFYFTLECPEGSLSDKSFNRTNDHPDP